MYVEYLADSNYHLESSSIFYKLLGFDEFVWRVVSTYPNFGYHLSTFLLYLHTLGEMMFL